HVTPVREPRKVLVHALDAIAQARAITLHVAAGHEVFLGGQMLEDPPALEHLDHAAPDDVVGRQVIDALARQLDSALVDGAALGRQQAGDGLERRRLARAVGAEQRRDAALADVDRHALEDEDHAVVNDLDVVERQHEKWRLRSRGVAGRGRGPGSPLVERGRAGPRPWPAQPTTSYPPPCYAWAPRP